MAGGVQFSQRLKQEGHKLKVKKEKENLINIRMNF